jgi:hypothetical protein
MEWIMSARSFAQAFPRLHGTAVINTISRSMASDEASETDIALTVSEAALERLMEFLADRLSEDDMAVVEGILIADLNGTPVEPDRTDAMATDAAYAKRYPDQGRLRGAKAPGRSGAYETKFPHHNRLLRGIS